MSNITKKKQKPQLTLLQAVETLAESSKDSKLSNDFMKSVNNETKFLAKQYGITERQAVLFAVCMDEGPGTGKTETVYQLARQTGRAIMMVDVPSIRSKWVGETEKNIKAVFDRYRELVRRNARPRTAAPHL